MMHGKQVTIVGGGPAGLMAAEVLSAAGVGVTVYEAMPTVARKFLMAGKSGLNITHAEAYDAFTTGLAVRRAGFGKHWTILRPICCAHGRFLLDRKRSSAHPGACFLSP